MTARSRLLILYVFLPTGQALAQKKPYNVLFIAVDDLRHELGCYGASYIHSPNIDKLARRGVLFTRAYCQQALWSPSRTSLLTGLRPDSTGVHDLDLHFRQTIPTVTTLPQHFKNNGYFTAFWGKIYHAWHLDKASWSVAGDDQLRRLEPQWPKENWRAYALEENIRLANANDSFGPIIEKADLPDNAYPDGKVADSTVASLKRLKNSDKPFFLAVGFYKPHIPWTAPAKYWDYYPIDKVSIPANFHEPVHGSRFGFKQLADFGKHTDVEKQKLLTLETTRRLRQAYYANVSYVDAQIGKVLDELERQGLAQNTIVVLWGDHGFKLGEYGAWEKSTNSELDARVPLIIRAPFLKNKGGQANTLAELVDLYPTLSELAGLPKPAHLHGVSLLEALKNQGVSVKKKAFSQYPKRDGSRNAMGYSLRDDRYRLTVWLSQDTTRTMLDVDLFDHGTDDRENYSIARELSREKFRQVVTSVLENAGYRLNGFRREPDILAKLMFWKNGTQ